jgi:hypothetical protein
VKNIGSRTGFVADVEHWVEQQFGRCDLGDIRRTQLLLAHAARQAAQPDGSTNAVCAGDDAVAEGACRWMRNSAVGPKAVDQGPFLANRRRLWRVPGALDVHVGDNHRASPGARDGRAAATVYAFEPNPLCQAILRQRFSHMPHVTVLENGVMDEDCVLTLVTPDAHEGFDRIDTTQSASFVADAHSSKRYSVSRTDVLASTWTGSSATSGVVFAS